jgi:hypothetical protein
MAALEPPNGTMKPQTKKLVTHLRLKKPKSVTHHQPAAGNIAGEMFL